MDNKLRKKAEKILSQFPHISSYELADILNIDERQARKLIKNLPQDILEENVRKFIKDKKPEKKSDNNAYKKSHIGEVLKGTVSIHKDGYGFFIPDDKNIEDAFIHPKKLKEAAHNDICLARIGIYKGKREAEVVQIIERGIEQVVGVVEKHRSSYRVIPFSRNFQGHIIIKNCPVALHDDDVVLCKIERYPSGHNYASGRIIEKIGTLSDKDIDNKIIMYKYSLSGSFPETVMQECSLIENGTFKINKKDLTDFRDIYTVTIDGESARDFDDAISISKKGSDYELYVHIADVSRYVQRGSHLNMEAQARGTSVYFPEFAIPMLPEVLSNGVCSLVPHEDRFTVTCRMVFDKNGHKKVAEFYRSIINSNHRLTYTFVNQVFNEKAESEDEKLVPFLNTAKELTDILLAKRQKDGVIDFDLPEAEFIFDDNGEILDIKPYERGLAERLIECFMIAANESAAEFFEENDLKGIYRVHDEPDTKKIDDWVEMARNFGLKVPPLEYPVTPETVAELSKIASSSKHADLLGSLLVRSMMRAEYTTENKGHFGLASSAYTHFTSPIRRYPDLLVHRALLSALKLGSISEQLEELKELAAHCSKRERVAQDAEHDIGSFKKLEYISNHYDDVFTGYINRITGNGIFIYIEKLMMTGYIDYSYIDFDIFYKYGETATGERTGERYRVGDKIRVIPYKIDIMLLQADFTIYRKKGKKK
ncbi:MAG: ribonuclease R [Mucispirillum sp.]|nr:ribonuclease R [Mucispirillum sp.]